MALKKVTCHEQCTAYNWINETTQQLEVCNCLSIFMPHVYLKMNLCPLFPSSANWKECQKVLELFSSILYWHERIGKKIMQSGKISTFLPFLQITSIIYETFEFSTIKLPFVSDFSSQKINFWSLPDILSFFTSSLINGTHFSL